MIWRNPWAWLGLAALALPVLIHLLGRGHARVQPFPSLRFLERSKLLPTRRTRLHDVALLAVRLAILAAAVAALAQPFLLTGDRTRVTTTTMSRAILVDTSTSMRRATPNGESALDAARNNARRLAAEARTSLVIESSSPARELSGADAWLGRQSARRELVVISDFQAGTLDSADLRAVQPNVGVQLVPIVVAPTSTALLVTARSPSGSITARIAAAPASTDVEWTLRSNVPSPVGDVLLLAAVPDRPAADAASRAAKATGVRLPLDSTRAVAIVFPSYEQRADLARRAGPLDAPWMTDVVARLRSDSLLIAAAHRTTVVAPIAEPTGVVVARDAGRRPIVVAAKSDADGRPRLLLFSAADPRSLTSAALIAAVDRARSIAPPLAELEPATIADQTLAAWQREPATDAGPNTNRDSTESDGRWLWIVALALLGLETWLRRTRPPKAPFAEITRERAA